jgi:hypothetical protein
VICRSNLSTPGKRRRSFRAEAIGRTAAPARYGLAIRERLAQSDPGSAGWQRDLSVSYNKVGDVQMAQGDLAGSLKSHRDSLAIAERLAQSDPGNAGWQRDLSVSSADIKPRRLQPP